MDSVEQLFKNHYALVCTVVYRYVRDRSIAEDIAQDIFTELWVKRDQLHIHSSPGAYLRRMAVTRSLNYLRDAKKHNWEELDTDLTSTVDVSHESGVLLKLEEEDLKKQLYEAIALLPEKCRIVFLLSRDEEMSYAAIATQLQISIKTVENQIGKALRLLRAAVEEQHRGKTK